jgi:malonyl CoA-acyl carrier protein transacylase
MRKTAFMFSGQGSHYFQMGRDLFDRHAPFRSTVLDLDGTAAPLLGRSIVDVLYYDGRTKHEIFDDVRMTSAAIFIIEYATGTALIDAGVKPDFLLGVSLGTYAAAALASVFDAKAALTTVVTLATILDQRCPPGCMLGVLGHRSLHSALLLNETSEIAAIFFDSHFVLATLSDHLGELTARLTHENISTQPIAVRRAFHSQWIDGAQREALAYLASVEYEPPQIPVICCARAAALDAVSADSLWAAVRMPIEFEKTARELDLRGPHRYIDAGPSGTLATALKYCLPPSSRSAVFPVLTPFGADFENYQKLAAEAGASESTSAASVRETARAAQPIVPNRLTLGSAEQVGSSVLSMEKRDMEAFLFPGQGSQKRGMGAGLFDETPEFKAAEHDVDVLLGFSVRNLCIEGPGDELNQTQYTQPCLYVVNALHYYRAIAEGRRPSYLAGHSLGEYNALLAAGAFDFVTGLRLVQKRGELMAQAKNGAMAAVIGLSPEVLRRTLAQHGLASLDIANYNSPSQTVVSGLADDIQRAGPIVQKAGAQLFAPLPVSAAFHSRQMASAASAFDAFLDSFDFKELTTPVVSNVTGQVYPSDSPRTTIRSLLVKQIVRPVLWTQSIGFLMSKGIETLTELGPGNVLTRLTSQIKAA